MSTYDEANDDVELGNIKEMIKIKYTDVSNSNGKEDDPRKRERSNDLEQHDILGDEAGEVFYTTDNTETILTTSRKKKKSKQIELTSEETKSAKLEYKKISRKMRQLEQRRAIKDRRVELYKTLENHALTKTEASLMTSSSTLGRRTLTKKEQLVKILRMERAGISLTDEQRDMLYTSTLVDEGISIANPVDVMSSKSLDSSEMLESTVACEENSSSLRIADNDIVIPLSFPLSGKQREKKNRKNVMKDNISDKNMGDLHSDQARQPVKDLALDSMDMVKSDTHLIQIPINQNNESVKNTTQQMFASLKSLKSQTDSKMKVLLEKTADKVIDRNSLLSKEEVVVNRPTAIALETAASSSINESKLDANSEQVSILEPLKPIKDHEKNSLSMSKSTEISYMKDKVVMRTISVNRPSELLETRNQLPVIHMEFDIIESVRNNAVTIICSDTGSGKSTQVPQFLYESGITSGSVSKTTDDDESLLIGVTQPRRVAAITTAKRVCYEMGFSEDQGMTIPKNRQGNVVAYQTRYESAGIGKRTRIKFMTDGILLQEMKSDLLLRKYSVIVLDEAHERNLNTDILLGLLSAAIALRDKTFAEGSLPPLKLVIMSATLRVEDFVGNSRLFPTYRPNVVRIPGRTFPVTIHHSKVTELNKYEDLAFRKICQIHRKLPQGGILVFLTGQQEIIRMVKRLKNALFTDRKASSKETWDAGLHQYECIDGRYNSAVSRDMDDDEVDGDLFQEGTVGEDSSQDDVVESTVMDEFVDVTNPTTGAEARYQNGPSEVLILPLFSLLSATEQANVFKVVPDNTRLIVVATNVAETSITIPGIKYVVDTGRQKCRNYHPLTGMASYDIMWISQASADQV